MNMKEVAITLFVAAAATLQAGCALGVSRVTLEDPLAARAGNADSAVDRQLLAVPPDGPPKRVAFRKIRDARPDVSCVGVKKNSYGMPMGKVDLEKGVVFIDVFTGHLRECFERSGFEVVGKHTPEGRPESNSEEAVQMVDAEVRAFWVEFMPGLFVVDASSKVIFDVSIVDADTNRELWSETFRGEGQVSGLAVTRLMFERSLNAAYAEAMQSLQEGLCEGETHESIEPARSAGSPHQ